MRRIDDENDSSKVARAGISHFPFLGLTNFDVTKRCGESVKFFVRLGTGIAAHQPRVQRPARRRRRVFVDCTPHDAHAKSARAPSDQARPGDRGSKESTFIYFPRRPTRKRSGDGRDRRGGGTRAMATRYDPSMAAPADRGRRQFPAGPSQIAGLPGNFVVPSACRPNPSLGSVGFPLGASESRVDTS